MINRTLSNEPIQYLNKDNGTKRLQNFKLYTVTKDEEVFFVIANSISEILESQLFQSDYKLEIKRENLPLFSFKSLCVKTQA